MNTSNISLEARLDKIWQFCSSKALTLYLLGLLGAYYLTVIILTGRDVATLTRGIDIWVSQGGDLPLLLATNMWAKLFACLLILNLGARIARSLRQKDFRLAPAFAQGIDQNTIFQQPFHTVMNFQLKKTSQSKSDAVIRVLKSHGFLSNSASKGKSWRIYAIRGQVRFWPLFIMKIGLLLCLSGLVLSMMTRTGGSTTIGEGQVIGADQVKPQTVRYSWRLSSEVAKGASLSSLPWTYMKIESIDPGLNKDFSPKKNSWIFAHQVIADLVIATKSFKETSAKVRIYSPSYLSGYYLLLYRFGIGPEIRVQDATGQDIYRSSLFMNLLPVGRQDFFEVPGLPYTFSLEILKGPVKLKREMITSKDVHHPIYLLRIFRDKKEVFEQVVKPDGIVKYQDFVITIPRTRFWVGVGIIKDWGVPVVALGLTVSLIGLFFWLVLKVIINREELFFVLEPEGKYNRLYLGMKSERVKSWWSAGRFYRLAREIDEVLGGEIK